jgi:hypothetical protein
MIAAINLASQGAALQGAGSKVEGEGHQRIELTVCQRPGDEAQDGRVPYTRHTPGADFLHGNASPNPYPTTAYRRL